MWQQRQQFFWKHCLPRGCRLGCLGLCLRDLVFRPHPCLVFLCVFEMEKNKTEEQLVAADYAEVIAKCER